MEKLRISPKELARYNELATAVFRERTG